MTQKGRKTIHLVLKHKWWNMIESGVKTEEYREIKPYYEKRLLYVYDTNDTVLVCFHKGYTSETMTFVIEGVSIGKGNPEWGAPDKDVFIIRLGRRQA